MSDLAVRPGATSGDAAFSIHTVAILLAIGIAGFVGTLVLGAYAPDMRSGQNGGAHALSNGATGYSAIVRLAAATGRNPMIVRNPRLFKSEDLLIVTPESGSMNITEPLNARLGKPTLVVFPKWSTAPDPDHRGWVVRTGIVPRYDPQGILAPDWQFSIERRRGAGRRLIAVDDTPTSIASTSPSPIQVIARTTLKKQGPGPNIRQDRSVHPMLIDGRGGIVLARLGAGPLYVLADPDLLNNQGMKDPERAAAALAMLDWLNANQAEGIAFDVTLNGFGHSSSPLKLAFDPPLLAMTLSIAATFLLVGCHAFGRFGAPARRTRAIAFGKAALVDNSAAMIARAGYQARLGDRYASVIRERAAVAFGAPPRLHDAALDEYLDRLSGPANGHQARFTDLARAADAAIDRQGLVAAARALHHWYKERMG